MAAAGPDKITLTFDTSRFGVRLMDGQFEQDTTVGDVHARLRKKLVKEICDSAGAPQPTYCFLRNATEAFIPSPSQTLRELFETYAVSRESRTLSISIDTEVFSG